MGAAGPAAAGNWKKPVDNSWMAYSEAAKSNIIATFNSVDICLIMLGSKGLGFRRTSVAAGPGSSETKNVESSFVKPIERRPSCKYSDFILYP
jgi:hypothetical protein